jgi:hypothetical protein
LASALPFYASAYFTFSLKATWPFFFILHLGFTISPPPPAPPGFSSSCPNVGLTSSFLHLYLPSPFHTWLRSTLSAHWFNLILYKRWLKFPFQTLDSYSPFFVFTFSFPQLGFTSSSAHHALPTPYHAHSSPAPSAPCVAPFFHLLLYIPIFTSSAGFTEYL